MESQAKVEEEYAAPLTSAYLQAGSRGYTGTLNSDTNLHVFVSTIIGLALGQYTFRRHTF